MVSGTTDPHTVHTDPMVRRDVRDVAGVTHTDVHSVQANVYTPTDRVRWGSVVAGLFAALSTLAVLSVLGLAVGLSSYDAGDRARTFGFGAGWWGAISALLAFAVGGWLAARTAAVRGNNNGMLQGAMVWMVAVPMLVYLVGSLLSSTLNAAGQVAGASANVAATASNNPDVANQASARLPSADEVKAKAQETADRVRANATPEKVEQVTHDAAKGAWGTLVSLILGLGAAAGGGLLGARDLRRPAVAVA